MSFPFAVHQPTMNSPTTKEDEDNGNCGMEIFVNFVSTLNVNNALDCIGDLEPIDFDGNLQKTKAMANAYLGNTNVWGL